MNTHTPIPAPSLAVNPDAVAQRCGTPPASNLPQADAGAFTHDTKPQWCGVPALDAEPTRAAITSGNPDDAARGFSALFDRVAVVLAEAAHERLVDKAQSDAGVSGVVALRRNLQRALHDRMAAENKLNR